MQRGRNEGAREKRPPGHAHSIFIPRLRFGVKEHSDSELPPLSPSALSTVIQTCIRSWHCLQIRGLPAAQIPRKSELRQHPAQTTGGPGQAGAAHRQPWRLRDAPAPAPAASPPSAGYPCGEQLAQRPPGARVVDGTGTPSGCGAGPVSPAPRHLCAPRPRRRSPGHPQTPSNTP